MLCFLFRIRFKAKEGFYFVEKGSQEQRLRSAERGHCYVSLQMWQHPCMAFPSGTGVVGTGFVGSWVSEGMQL